MAEPDPRSGLAVASVRTFIAHAILWNIGLIGLMRWPGVADHVIGALISFQTSLIFWYGATPNPALVVNDSCSGSDVAALCAAITLSYPVAWRRRIAGALTGLLVIVALNTVRIASLYAVASSPDTLTLLHLYVWPTALVAAAVAYVWLWIRWSERGTSAVGSGWVRFFKLSLGGLTAYAAAVPWVFTSAALGTVGVWTASAAASTLASLGVHVSTAGNVLMTPRGAFQVTQECLFTPLVPLYVAAVFSWPLQRSARVAWVALGVPLFFVLGIARMLVLALPPSIAEQPIFLAHGFYQMLAGCVAIVLAAHLAFRGEPARAVSLRTATALGAATVGALALGPVWHDMLLGLANAVHRVLPATLISFSTPADEQGALAMLPTFQIGLTLGLWVAMTGGRRWTMPIRALGILAVSQIALLILLGALAEDGINPHALSGPGVGARDPAGTGVRRLAAGGGNRRGRLNLSTVLATHRRDLPCADRCRVDRVLLRERETVADGDLSDSGRSDAAQDRSLGRGQEHADSSVGGAARGGGCRHRYLRAHRPPGTRGVRRALPATRGERRAAPAIRGRFVRRDLLDGHRRALRGDGSERRGAGPHTQTVRTADSGRSEPSRSVPAAAARGRAVASRAVRLRLREELLPPLTPKDARSGRTRGQLGNRHPLHAGMAADAGPVVSYTRPISDRSSRPRSSRRLSGSTATLPGCDVMAI